MWQSVGAGAKHWLILGFRRSLEWTGRGRE